MGEQSLDLRLTNLLKEGRKIEAIKLCKVELEIEHQEAKTYVEELISELIVEKQQDSSTLIPELLTVEKPPLIINPVEEKQPKRAEPATPLKEVKVGIKDDGKISWKTKIITAVVCLIILKGCSYSSNGGADQGVIFNVLFKIADTVIPWPETRRDHTFADVLANRNKEVESSESEKGSEPEETEVKEGIDSDTYSTSSGEGNNENQNNSEEEQSEDSQTEEENLPNVDKRVIVEVEEDSPGSGEMIFEGGGRKGFGINCTCPVVGWSTKYVVLQRKENDGLIIFNRNGNSRYIDILRKIQHVTVTESRIIVKTSSGNEYYSFTP